jgi:LacI family transcriptional regulator
MSRIAEINGAGRAEMIQVEALSVDEQDPHKTAQSLSRLKPEEYDGIAIMAPETPQIRDAIRRMQERGIHTIAFIANQQDSDPGSFVGIDNCAAGATAGRIMGRFSCGRTGSVAVITDTMQSRDSLERRLGFDDVINHGFQTLNVLPSVETYGDPDRARQIIQNVFRTHQNLVGLYIMGSEARIPLDLARRFCTRDAPIIIAHERTPSTVAALRGGKLDALITQDPGHLVRSAVRILRAKCEGRSTVASQEKIRIEILLADNL